MKNLPLEKIGKYLDGNKIVLVDVGARGGISERWKNIYPILQVVGFEPDKQECEKINSKSRSAPYSLHCYPFALGQFKNNKANFNICKDPGCCSVYEPNTDFVKDFNYASNMEVIERTQITLNTLDDVCDNDNLRPDCVKIDTQGYELEILKGARAVLEQVKFLELEVEFNPQYKDQPLFSDVDLFLREHGFLLLGIRRTNWRRTTKDNFFRSSFGGQLMHGDAIYYNAKLLKEAKSVSLIEIIKFCIIFSVYKQDDFVTHLMSYPEGILSNVSEDERKIIVEALHNSRSPVSSIVSSLLNLIRKVLYIPHRSLRRSVDALQDKNAVDWHDPDFF